MHLQLADKNLGVIGVDFKQVSCDKLGPVDSTDSSKDSPRHDDDKSQRDHGDDKGKDDRSSTSDWIDKKKAEFAKKRDSFFSKRPSWAK